MLWEFPSCICVWTEFVDGTWVYFVQRSRLKNKNNFFIDLWQSCSCLYCFTLRYVCCSPRGTPPPPPSSPRLHCLLCFSAVLTLFCYYPKLYVGCCLIIINGDILSFFFLFFKSAFSTSKDTSVVLSWREL